ncbi:hypothetical protein GOV13_04595 [Candidatus Pacearchaeota archaeon]|nr:hypothetical protein [Candidatus Pacearchaeota archaeon]
MAKEKLKINKDKIKFWDRFFWTTVALLIIPMILYLSISEEIYNIDIIGITLGGAILISIIMILIFRIGMVYNAYKIKRYGWMVVNLILGELFVIIFYFAVLKKYISKDKQNKKE